MRRNRCVSLYLPASQSLQTDAPAAEYLPAAQSVQTLLVCNDEPKNLPATQLVQTEAPAAEYLPATQLGQTAPEAAQRPGWVPGPGSVPPCRWGPRRGRAERSATQRHVRCLWRTPFGQTRTRRPPQRPRLEESTPGSGTGSSGPCGPCFELVTRGVQGR